MAKIQDSSTKGPSTNQPRGQTEPKTWQTFPFRPIGLVPKTPTSSSEHVPYSSRTFFNTERTSRTFWNTRRFQQDCQRDEEVQEDAQDEFQDELLEECQQDDLKEHLLNLNKNSGTNFLQSSTILENSPSFKPSIQDDVRDELRGELRDKLEQDLHDELREELRNQLEEDVRDELRAKFKQDVHEELRVELRSKLRGKLREELLDNLRDELGDKLYDAVRNDIVQHEWEYLKKELNDKNEMMKDVVEAYETLFDEMKSNHNIKHLNSNMESNLDSNLESNLDSNLESNLDSNLESNLDSNLENREEESETSLETTSTKASVTNENDFSYYIDAFKISMFCCFVASICNFPFSFMIAFNLKCLLQFLIIGVFTYVFIKVLSKVVELSNLDFLTDLNLDDPVEEPQKTTKEASKTVINEKEDLKEVEIETLKNSLEKISSENVKLKNFLEKTSSRSQRWYRLTKELSTEKLDLESELNESKASHLDQEEKIQKLEHVLEDMKQELNEWKIVSFTLGGAIHMYFFGIYSLFFIPFAYFCQVF